MKSLSKKVMAGLLVGATSLSIWAPASQAETPEKNKYYSIYSKVNSTLAWTPYSSSYDGAITNVIKLNMEDNQKYLFFPLNGGSYAIVNKSSGKVASIHTNLVVPRVGSFSCNGSSGQKWNLRDKGNGYYEFMNQGNGKVAATTLNSSGAIQDLSVGFGNSNPSDPEKLFSFSSPIASIMYQTLNMEENPTFSLPNLPNTGTRPAAPEYTGGIDQQLPQTSNSVVVGASLIPCIMVNDNSVDEYTKLHNSPYYTLIKEEFWDKTFSAVIPSGLTRNYAFKTGMTTVDQQKMTDTLSMKIGADLGLKFGDLTAAVKAEISRTIQTEISTTNTEASEETITSTVASEPGKTTGFTEYQLATKYTLKRADGSLVSEPWIVKNNKITIARKNAQ
ncbi:RICIN domain-containing protein [Bacillus cereus]|uniref:RICIN domain-containing protein n=1 Tax=Bacillus cereus TaxID=1396 RepID=UPI0009AB0DC2|nr:RICIN domain-containing protein [Bacillus cereus]PFI17293.1 toxin [Bacillus cereus]